MLHMRPFGLEVSTDGGWVRVAVLGEVDMASASQLQDTIMQSVELGPDVVLVDLRNVTFMDSTGLAALMVCHRLVASGQRRMRVVNPSKSVQRLLELSGVSMVLEGGSA